MDGKQLGNNIRALRNAYYESQEELGVVLGVVKSAVSAYENGKRQPDRGMLSKIAAHYWVSVEELCFCDLTGTRSIDLNVKVFLHNICHLFPIIKTEEAMKNQHFRKAHRWHELFLSGIQNNNGDFDELFICFEEYGKAYEDANIEEETEANLLGLCLLFIAICRVTKEAIIVQPKLVKNAVKKDKYLKRIIERKNEITKEIDEVLPVFEEPEFIEMINEMMTTLKQSKRWNYLADYYLALGYMFNNVDNGLDWSINRRIGAEMLRAFASLGNPYAIRYIKISLRVVRPSSHIVDK